eukprot:2388315-Pleurochrysis_carterae.AAC.1
MTPVSLNQLVLQCVNTTTTITTTSIHSTSQIRECDPAAPDKLPRPITAATAASSCPPPPLPPPTSRRCEGHIRRGVIGVAAVELE